MRASAILRFARTIRLPIEVGASAPASMGKSGAELCRHGTLRMPARAIVCLASTSRRIIAEQRREPHQVCAAIGRRKTSFPRKGGHRFRQPRCATNAGEVLPPPDIASFSQFFSCSTGAYEIPTIAPSGD